MNTTNPNPTLREPTLLTSLRALPRPVWILFLGTFLNKFGSFVVPFLALYMAQEGYSVGSAGMAIGAYGVGHLIASLLGGHLADTIGRRKTIVISMFSAAVVMLLLSQAHSLPAIVVLTALAGLTAELYRPAASALLADLVQPSERVTAFAAYRVAFNAGWAFGPATAGFLAERGYFWLFAGDAVTSVLFGLVALFSLPRGVRSQRTDVGWNEALRAFREDRRFHQVMVASFAIALIFFQMSSTFGLYITGLGFSAATYGALISLNGVLVVLCELPLTTITRRFPARNMMAAGYLLAGIGFALNLFAHTVPALMGCMIIFTLGEMVAMPVSSAFIASLAPSHMRGRYMGTFGLTWACGLIIGPAMGMKLFALEPLVFWLVGGVLGLFAAVTIFAAGKPEPVRVTRGERA